MVGMLVEFERAQPRKRVQVGIERARKAGKRFGRPVIHPELAEAIRASLGSGLSIRKTARLHGVGISTVQRLKKAGEAGAPTMRPGELGRLAPVGPGQVREPKAPERREGETSSQRSPAGQGKT
jgi:helix-turn-helix, Psq domain